MKNEFYYFINTVTGFFFIATPPYSLFSYAAFLDLPSHLDDIQRWRLQKTAAENDPRFT